MHQKARLYGDCSYRPGVILLHFNYYGSHLPVIPDKLTSNILTHVSICFRDIAISLPVPVSGVTVRSCWGGMGDTGGGHETSYHICDNAGSLPCDCRTKHKALYNLSN